MNANGQQPPTSLRAFLEALWGPQGPGEQSEIRAIGQEEQCGAVVRRAARAPEDPDSVAAASSAEAGAPDESVPGPDAEALLHRAIAALPEQQARRLLGLLQEPDSYLRRYPSRSELDFVAASLLAGGGLTDPEITQVWQGCALGARQKVQAREDYLMRTLAAVRTRQKPADSILPPIDRRAGGIESDALCLFQSPAQLAGSVPPEVEWLWEGYLAPGALTALAAREKTGKSTLVCALLQPLLAGGTFLGQPCRATRVVYLSEEPGAAVLEKLARFGLTGEEQRVSLVTRTTLGGRRLPLPTVVRLAIAEAERIGAGLLVLDTLAFWADLPPEAENDSGAVRRAMRPLLDATSRGLAVLVLHHLSKATGELRGSTAIAAAADIILTLHRDTSNRRRLDGVGRYQATPERIVIELEGDTYRELGTPAAVEAADRVAQVYEAVPAEGQGATLAELARGTGVPAKRVGEALQVLLREDKVTRFGAGVKGDPYRHLRADSILPGFPLDTKAGRNASQGGDGSQDLATESGGNSILPGSSLDTNPGRNASQRGNGSRELATESGGDSIPSAPSSTRESGEPPAEAAQFDLVATLREWDGRIKRLNRKARRRGGEEADRLKGEAAAIQRTRQDLLEAAMPEDVREAYEEDQARLMELEAEVEAAQEALKEHPAIRYARWARWLGTPKGQARFERAHARLDVIANELGYGRDNPPQPVAERRETTDWRQFVEDVMAIPGERARIRDLKKQRAPLKRDLAKAESGDFDGFMHRQATPPEAAVRPQPGTPGYREWGAGLGTAHSHDGDVHREGDAAAA